MVVWFINNNIPTAHFNDVFIFYIFRCCLFGWREGSCRSLSKIPQWPIQFILNGKRKSYIKESWGSRVSSRVKSSRGRQARAPKTQYRFSSNMRRASPRLATYASARVHAHAIDLKKKSILKAFWWENATKQGVHVLEVSEAICLVLESHFLTLLTLGTLYSLFDLTFPSN